MKQAQNHVQWQALVVTRIQDIFHSIKPTG